MKRTSEATAAYKSTREEIAASMKRLEKLLKDHKRKQAQKPLDWGFDGDLGYVAARLAEVVQFLAGEG